MQTLTPKDSQYQEIVNVKNSKEYDVDISKIPQGVEISCPFDSDMKFCISSEGECIVKKTSFIDPFVKTPVTKQ